MKINSNINQSVKQANTKAPKPESKAQNTKEAQTKPSDKNDIKAPALNAQAIKNANSNIGRLQVMEDSLDKIESNAKQHAKLDKEYKQALEKSQKDDIKDEMDDIKKDIESTMKKATFDGSNVFSKPIKDSNNKTILDPTKLNAKLLDSDSAKFYSTLKEQQGEIKTAMLTLQSEVDNEVNNKAKNVEKADTGFLNKFANLFKSSHDSSKLDNKRVQELLA